MKENKAHPARNNYLSSSELKYKRLDNIHDKFKENFGKIYDLNQPKKYAESHHHHNTNLSLVKFMEEQNKKHLSTNFDHKNVEKFLNEKDKAMEEIIIDEDSEKTRESGNDKDNDKDNSKEKNCNEKLVKFHEETNKKTKNDNNNNNIFIFHGTFGKDEYDRIKNNEHHHHHHKHHHHHNHNDSQNHNSDKNEHIIQKDNEKEMIFEY